MVTHEALGDPVFERVEADHHQAAARRQQFDALRQDQRQLFKLLVDVNPKSLEGARPYVREAIAAVIEGKPVTTAQTRAYGCSVKYR